MSVMDKEMGSLEVELFTDFVCPWCYLGNAVLEKARETVSLSVKRTPFPLHPDTPAEGVPLATLLKGVDLEAAHLQLYALMDDLGLEHGERNHTYNTRLAQELALWADSVRPDHQLDKLFYRAYFVHDLNLAMPGILLDICSQAGLDRQEAGEVLQTRRFSPQVDTAWQRAWRMGITGVPAFVAGNLLASGFMLPEQFGNFLNRASSATRSS